MCGEIKLCSVFFRGLAIDVERQKLYYTGFTNLGELSTNGTDHRVLISQVDMRPQAVVIDVDNRCDIM